MLLFWKLRHLDTHDRRSKDRTLMLDTEHLDPVNKAAVEMSKSLDPTLNTRDMVRFRHLFRECSSDEMQAMWPRYQGNVQLF